MRVMLQTPRTTPVVSMYWDLGAPLAVNRIIDYKVRFYYHLLHLSKESIASKIFDNQRKSKFGFAKECLEHLAVLNIKESDLLNYSEREFKLELAAKIKQKNCHDILNMMKSYKKIDYFDRKNEDFETKEYFKKMTFGHSRVMFGLKSEMI